MDSYVYGQIRNFGTGSGFDMHEAYKNPYWAENPRKPVRWMRTGLLFVGQVSH